VVHRLGRFGRSTCDGLDQVHALEGKGAVLRVLEPAVATAGDRCTQVKGICTGRKKQVDGRIRDLAAKKVPKAQIARDLRISHMSVCRVLKGGESPPTQSCAPVWRAVR